MSDEKSQQRKRKGKKIKKVHKAADKLIGGEPSQLQIPRRPEVHRGGKNQRRSR